MPRNKAIHHRTNTVCKKPLCDEQEQYRHSHGLSTLNLSTRECFQIQMASSTHASEKLCENAANLLCLHSLEPDNHLLNEIKLLMAMQSTTIQPINDYYFIRESSLCDVPPAIHDENHDYGPPRNRTIASLSDYDALHMTNFTKKQLLRIYCCFDFGYLRIDIHCSQGHSYWFEPQYIFLFGLVKMSSGLDNIMLCRLFFGGSPRRMSNAFKWFLITLHDRYYDTVLSYQGLSREVTNFPYYANKIARRFNQERFLIDNHTGERYDFNKYDLMDKQNCQVTKII